jgi:enamine deaminase RidA (YjgF/YER057c/UK114 family)
VVFTTSPRLQRAAARIDGLQRERQPDERKQPYSGAVRGGDFVFVSGQVAFGPIACMRLSFDVAPDER